MYDVFLPFKRVKLTLFKGYALYFCLQMFIWKCSNTCTARIFGSLKKCISVLSKGCVAFSLNEEEELYSNAIGISALEHTHATRHAI